MKLKQGSLPRAIKLTKGRLHKQVCVCKKPEEEKNVPIKGIVHQFFFCHSNLIFRIVMGCGIADFGRRGL